MKRLMTALVLLALCLPASAGWVEGSIAGVRDDNSKSPIAIFVNSGYLEYTPAIGVWHTIQVSSLGIPSTAKAVFLSGLLIITHGTSQQTCDLTISLRATGDTLSTGNYIGQTVETAVGGGQRSTMSSWVPVRNGSFEWSWNRSTYGSWPDECAYAINLSAQQYIR